jgi:hypothetical protein
MGQPETRTDYGRPLLPPPELDELDELDELLEPEKLAPLLPEECDDDPDELDPEECDPELPPPE